MSDEPEHSNDDGDPFPIEPDVPRLARIRNAISGGDANFSADRTVVKELADAAPTGLEGLQAVIEALHRFKARAVRTVAAESGIRQFLHIGTATSSTGMVHEQLRPIVPGARVVYASYDTTTLAHVHDLWRDAPEGSVAHVHSRFEDPQRILDGATETLDLDDPVAALLPTSLNVLSDEDAQALVDALRGALVSGSYLVVAETSLDIYAEGAAEVVEVLNAALEEPYIARSRDAIAHQLEGFDLIEPGLVPVEHWRNDGDPPFLPEGQLVPLFAAVGRKP